MIAERSGSTSTRRRLFDMDSLLAPDNCSAKQTYSLPPRQHAATTVQGHDQSQGRERDPCRQEEVDEIVENDDYEQQQQLTHTVSVSVIMATVSELKVERYHGDETLHHGILPSPGARG